MTVVKICGVKTIHDAMFAMQAGADMIGFNFYPKSPRYVEVGECRDIMFVMRKYGHVKYVGVFVNSPLEDILAAMDTCGLSFAQLHGDESVDMLNALEGKSFKAFRGGVDENLIVKNEPAFLIDAQVKDVYGGSGVKADWNIAGELAKKYKFLLAGGLTPENVGDAVSRVKPWGVDVASGVESSPGVKDEAKVSAFIKAVREVENQI